MEEYPRLVQIKGGWAAHGKGWAVHGATRQEALRLFEEARERHQVIAERPMFYEAPRSSDAQF